MIAMNCVSRCSTVFFEVSSINSVVWLLEEGNVGSP